MMPPPPTPSSIPRRRPSRFDSATPPASRHSLTHSHTVKTLEITAFCALATSCICFAAIVLGVPVPTQAIAAIWFAALLIATAVAALAWHRHVEIPLQKLSCLITLAQQQNDKNTPFLEIKNLEHLQNALQTLLQNAQQDAADTSVIAEMSHEIRTPLNGIIGFISNLNDTQLSQQQRQFIKIISSSAHALLHVINQVLDYSKLNAGSLELENVAFDLHALAQDRIAIAAQLAKGKGLKVYLVFPQDTDTPTIVRGDPNRLRQVLDNLLSNAVKFTPAGEVCLEITLSHTDSGTLAAAFSVRDTGIGIPQQTIPNLFRPYRQADPSIARNYGGTGLGLCISHSLVKLMGGNLNLRSAKGEGSTFFFSLLLEPARPEEQVRLPGPFSIRLPKAELRKHRALLVDDTPTNLFLLETVCQNAGLPYRTATNGQEAVDLCILHKFDIIFMDIQMPVMDGYTAIRKIRELPNTATAHIVALTASAFQDDVDRALGAGSTEFIPKPFEKNQLLLSIADALAITPEKILEPQHDSPTQPDDDTIRHIHEFMREQYQLSLGEIKLTLAQTVTDWRPLLDDLHAHVRANNREQAQAILHKLKGQLASIGLHDFAQTAALLNDTLRQDDAEPITTQVDDFIRSLSRIFRTLEQDVTLVDQQA